MRGGCHALKKTIASSREATKDEKQHRHLEMQIAVAVAYASGTSVMATADETPTMRYGCRRLKYPWVPQLALRDRAARVQQTDVSERSQTVCFISRFFLRGDLPSRSFFFVPLEENPGALVCALTSKRRKAQGTGSCEPHLRSQPRVCFENVRFPRSRNGNFSPSEPLSGRIKPSSNLHQTLHQKDIIN